VFTWSNKEKAISLDRPLLVFLLIYLDRTSFTGFPISAGDTTV